MFLAACITNPGSEWSTVQIVGRMWPTVDEVRENFETAWATFNGQGFGYSRETVKAYAILQVVEGVEVDSRMTFKRAGVDAFQKDAAKPAKKSAE